MILICAILCGAHVISAALGGAADCDLGVVRSFGYRMDRMAPLTSFPTACSLRRLCKSPLRGEAGL
jgi:hypothetical protein